MADASPWPPALPTTAAATTSSSSLFPLLPPPPPPPSPPLPFPPSPSVRGGGVTAVPDQTVCMPRATPRDNFE